MAGDDIDKLAKAVVDGHAPVSALLDDQVFDRAIEHALGHPRMRAVKQLAEEESTRKGLVEARFGKAGDMSIFNVDPEMVSQMSEEQLIMYSTRVQQGLAGTKNEIEKQQYLDFAAELRKAITNLAASKEAMAKAIAAPKAQEEPVDEAPPPAKNKGKTVNDQGKDAYAYDKPHGGKGPGKQPKSKKTPIDPKAGAANSDQPNDPQLTPPAPIDPQALAKQLGVQVKTLQALAKTKSREQFTQLFLSNQDVTKQFHLTAQYLSSLYDTLTSPPAPTKPGIPPGAATPSPAPAGPAPGKAPPSPAKLGKAVLHFVGTSQDPQSQDLLKALKRHRVRNDAQMQRVLKAHFAISEQEAVHLTRTLLRRWESDHVVSLAPT